MDFKSIDIDCFIFRRSSAVEQLTVNQLVVGSIPTAGAIKTRGLAEKRPLFIFSKISKLNKFYATILLEFRKLVYSDNDRYERKFCRVQGSYEFN